MCKREEGGTAGGWMIVIKVEGLLMIVVRLWIGDAVLTMSLYVWVYVAKGAGVCVACRVNG